MDIIPACAIAAGGIVILFLLNRLRPFILQFVSSVLVFTSKHVTYPYLVHRHRHFGPWSRGGVTLCICSFSLLVFCISFNLSIFPIRFRLSTITEAASRAGTLALITLTPLLASVHHAFVADILGVSLRTIRLIHRSAGAAMSLLCLLHILLAVASNASLSLDSPRNLFAVIVGASSQSADKN
jgi:hypothetical protein